MYFLLEAPARDLLYSLVGAASVVAIVVGVRLHRPAYRAPWFLFAAGQLSLVVGDALYTMYDLYLDAPPFPSVADVFYLGAYPLLAAGLWTLIRHRIPGRDVSSAIDAAIVATGIGILAWAYLVTPYADDPSLTILEKTVSVAYPLADVMLLAFVVRLFAGPGIRNAAFHLIGASVVLTLIADAWYAVAVLGDAYAAGDPIDAAWLLAYVCWAAAALHPSMKEVSQRSPQPEASLPRRRLVLLAAVALIAPAILALQAASDQPIQAPLIAGGSAALFLLVVARISGLAREVQSKVLELDAKGKGLREALDSREALEEQLRHQAFHDPLTKLPNRWLFADRLDHEIAVQARERDGVGVMFIDLDDFKHVNDSLGHAAGDQLLVAVAERLRSCLRGRDTAARFGGDEFAVLVSGVQDEATLEVLAARVVSIFDRPFNLGESEFFVRCSLGASFGGEGTNAGELVRSADVAMYVSKAERKHRWVVFNAAVHGSLVDRRGLRSALQQALERDEFIVFFQPIVRLRDRTAVGVEGLVRWRNPSRGVMTPDDFIPLAEEMGLIVDIDRKVMRAACQQVATWQRDLPGCSDLYVALNIADGDVQQARFVEQIEETLEETGLRPEDLVLEVTERTVLRDAKTTVEKLERLRALGVRIAIDDFGTGYSSLSYLDRFPIDILKIDKTFTQTVAGDAEESALARAVIKLGATLRIDVVAEGVESAEQLEALLNAGSSTGQGFLFSPPVGASAFEELVRRGPETFSMATEGAFRDPLR